MAIKRYKPTSPARRFMTVSAFTEITTTVPEKSLLQSMSKSGGRNATGRITVRHIGGGNRRTVGTFAVGMVAALSVDLAVSRIDVECIGIHRTCIVKPAFRQGVFAVVAVAYVLVPIGYYIASRPHSQSVQDIL